MERIEKAFSLVSRASVAAMLYLGMYVCVSVMKNVVDSFTDFDELAIILVVATLAACIAGSVVLHAIQQRVGTSLLSAVSALSAGIGALVASAASWGVVLVAFGAPGVLLVAFPRDADWHGGRPGARARTPGRLLSHVAVSGSVLLVFSSILTSDFSTALQYWASAGTVLAGALSLVTWVLEATVLKGKTAKATPPPGKTPRAAKPEGIILGLAAALSVSSIPLYIVAAWRDVAVGTLLGASLPQAWVPLLQVVAFFCGMMASLFIISFLPGKNAVLGLCSLVAVAINLVLLVLLNARVLYGDAALAAILSFLALFPVSMIATLSPGKGRVEGHWLVSGIKVPLFMLSIVLLVAGVILIPGDDLVFLAVHVVTSALAVACPAALVAVSVRRRAGKEVVLPGTGVAGARSEEVTNG